MWILLCEFGYVDVLFGFGYLDLVMLVCYLDFVILVIFYYCVKCNMRLYFGEI